jgi:hypothetical protein
LLISSTEASIDIHSNFEMVFADTEFVSKHRILGCLENESGRVSRWRNRSTLDLPPNLPCGVALQKIASCLLLLLNSK